MRLATTVLVLAVVVPGVHAQSKGRACRQGCAGLVAACAQVTEALGFGNIQRACRASVLKRCKREGVSACAGFCGDGIRGSREVCDGADLGGATCASFGFGRGTLACTPGCGLDPGGCLPAACGNAIREGGEECDGPDLGGATCETRGFASGALACNAQCGFAERNCDGEPEPLTLPISLLGNGRNAFWDRFDASPRFFVSDAAIARLGLGDAYDGFWLLSVGGSPYTPGRDATLAEGGQRTILSGALVPVGGLEVRQAFTVFNQRPTLRVLVSLTNSTGAPVDVPVAVTGDLGSDLTTTVEGTSSGDAIFDAADLWLVSSGGPGVLAVVNLFLFGGAGAAVAPAAATLIEDDVSVQFAVTVPAAATRYLLFLSEVHPSAEPALAAGASLNDLGALDDANLLGGLTAAQRAQIINWAP